MMTPSWKQADKSQADLEPQRPSSGSGPSSSFPATLPVSTIKDFALILYLLCVRDSFRTNLRLSL